MMADGNMSSFGSSMSTPHMPLVACFVEKNQILRWYEFDASQKAFGLLFYGVALLLYSKDSLFFECSQVAADRARWRLEKYLSSDSDASIRCTRRK